jgi:hypothetical protein
MSGSTNKAEHELLQTGALVEFRILDARTELSPDGENVSIHVDIILGGDDDDVEPADVAEWGTFGFLFVMAVLSFHDARPRGLSESDFLPDDQFTLCDLFECLSYRPDGIHLSADYVHGRCMKTDITVRADGTVYLETWGRGQTALRWLDKLQGKKSISLV